VLLPVLSFGLFLLATVCAILASDASLIVLYNQTGDSLPPVRLQACGRSKSFGVLPADSSVRWALDRTGSPSAIELELAQDPPVLWQGGWVAPRGGYRVTLHIWSPEQIEVHTQFSFWQRVLGRAPNVTD